MTYDRFLYDICRTLLRRVNRHVSTVLTLALLHALKAYITRDSIGFQNQSRKKI